MKDLDIEYEIHEIFDQLIWPLLIEYGQTHIKIKLPKSELRIEFDPEPIQPIDYERLH